MLNLTFSNLEHARVLTKAAFRASERLGIDQSNLSQLFEIDAARMLLLSSGQSVFDSGKPEWSHAIALVICYSRLCILLGDDDSINIAAWMSSHNFDLGKVPIQLLKEANGIKQLQQFLSNVRCF